MRPFAFVDCETTGLDPRHHEVYEIAITKTNDDGDVLESKDFWVEPLQLHKAAPGALVVGRYYGRREEALHVGSFIDTEELRYETAMEIARVTEDCHLVGAKPDFDAGFLNAFLRNNGAAPAWHHRLIDVESLAIGLIVGEADRWGRPESLSDICEELEIKRDGHTARGDCDAMQEAFFKLMGIAEHRERKLPA